MLAEVSTPEKLYVCIPFQNHLVTFFRSETHLEPQNISERHLFLCSSVAEEKWIFHLWERNFLRCAHPAEIPGAQWRSEKNVVYALLIASKKFCRMHAHHKNWRDFTGPFRMIVGCICVGAKYAVFIVNRKVLLSQKLKPLHNMTYS